MYYESISHEIIKVSDAAEAASKIKSNQAAEYQALSWKNENGVFYAVSDCHIDNSPFSETAILQEIGSVLYQTESITAAWVKSPRLLGQYFFEAETNHAYKRKTHLIVGKPTIERAQFECGCCGNSFMANVAEQIAFDQDNGYGICDDCNNYYK